MTILVTGGAGFIGSHTCVALLERGMQVIVADNLVNASARALTRVEQITGKQVVFYQTDIRDRAALEDIFARHAIDCVIHFAGLKAVGQSVEQPLAYYDNNLGCTVTLCQVMQAHGVKKLVFSSSATVYAPEDTAPLCEDDATGGCTNPYGWTKYMSEQILRDTAHAAGDWSVALLRYFNPIGAHPSGLIGENPRGEPNNLLPYVAQVAVGRQKRLRVYGNDYDTPDGTGVRDYIHVCDLARGHVAAIDYMESHSGVRVFNLGTGRGYSVLEVVHAFEKACGRKVPYDIVPRRAGDLATVYAAPDRSAAELGWRAQCDLAEMCRDAWNWQLHNPNGYGE